MPTLTWVTRTLGIPLFNRVTAVDLHGPDVTDDVIEQLLQLECLRQLKLVRTNVGKSSLAKLRRQCPALEIEVSNVFVIGRTLHH